MYTDLGRWLIGLGALLLLVGIVFLVLGRVPALGRLPGDIVIEREGLTVFIPLGTMLVASLVLTILANLIARIWR